MRFVLVSLLFVVSPLASAAPPEAGRARWVRTLGRASPTHPLTLRALAAVGPDALVAVDAGGAVVGWNVESRCPARAPLVSLGGAPGLTLAWMEPTRGLVTCGPDGVAHGAAVPDLAKDLRLTALAARREAETTRYVWGDASGSVAMWTLGEKTVQQARLAAGPVLAAAALPNGAVFIGGDGRLWRWSGGPSAPVAGPRLGDTVCPADREPCPAGTVRLALGALDPEGAWAFVSAAKPGFQGYGQGEGRSQLFPLHKGAASSGALRAKWTLNGILATAAAPLDGRTLALAVVADSASRLERVDLATGRLVRDAHPPSPVLAVAFSPDGRRIAAGLASGEVALWEAATGDALGRASLSPGPVVGLAFSPDGNRMAVQPQEGPARWADGKTAAPGPRLSALADAPLPRAATCRAVRAGAARDGGAPIEVVDEGEPGSRELAFSPDGGSLLATYAESRCAGFDACAPCAESYTPALVEVPTGTLRERWADADERHFFARCSAALGLPVTAGERSGAMAWLPNHVQKRLGSESGRAATLCDASGKALLLASPEKLELIAGDGSPKARFDLSSAPIAIALSPDGTLALVATGQEVRLVGLAEGRTLETLPLGRDHDAPRALAFSPDGEAFVVATRRGLVLHFGLLHPRPQ